MISLRKSQNGSKQKIRTGDKVPIKGRNGEGNKRWKGDRAGEGKRRNIKATGVKYFVKGAEKC